MVDFGRTVRTRVPRFGGFVILPYLILLCGGASWVTAAPRTLAEVRSSGTLTVGTTGDYPPFSYRDARTGRYAGSDIQAAESLAQHLGVRLRIVPTGWASLSQDLSAGRFDIAMGGVSVTPARAQAGHFTRPYLHDGKIALTRCGDQRRFAGLAAIDRPGIRIIENPGGTNERFARAHFTRAQVRIHADNDGVFDEILGGRADVMVTDLVEARLQHRLRPGLCVAQPTRLFEASRKAYLVAPDAALWSAVDQWLARQLAAGIAQGRLEHWLRYPWPLPPTPAQVLGRLVDERLLLMPDVARAKWNRGQAIEDLPREQALLESVRSLAPQYGLAPDRATAFFAAQIDASKVMQADLFARWRAEGRGPFDATRDLASDIRPRLDALTPRLLAALRSVPTGVTREALGPLGAVAISPAAADAAVAPVVLRTDPAP